MTDLIGYLALAITVFALVRKDNTHLLLLISIGVFLWGWHYFLLGSLAGAVIHWIASVGIFVAHATRYRRLRDRVWLAGVFVVTGIIGSFYQEITLINGLAALGGAVLTVSQHVLRGVRMRQGFVIGEFIIFLFAAAIFSIPGMAATFVSVAAGLIGLFRLARHTESDLQQPS
jgi:hypothetical protein